MRVLKTVIIVCLLLSLVSCKDKGDNCLPTENEKTDNVTTIEHQYLKNNTIPKDALSIKQGMTIDIPQLGLTNIFVDKLITTNKNNVSQLTVYILSDYRYKDEKMHDSYLAVAAYDKILFYDFKTSSLEDYVYLCDIDGDKIDEIIVSQLIDCFGTPGQYSSQVFKVKEENIEAIFDFREFDNNGNVIDYFDTGYSSILKDGYMLEIINKYTGYSKTLDFSDKRTQVEGFYNEYGKVIKQIETIGCSSFYKFEPTDYDDDAIYEIECVQVIKSMFETGYIGEAKSILKYDIKDQIFKLIDAEISYIE